MIMLSVSNADPSLEEASLQIQNRGISGHNRICIQLYVVGENTVVYFSHWNVLIFQQNELCEVAYDVLPLMTETAEL